MKAKLSVGALLVVVLCLGVSAVVVAQSNLGTIVGTVRDTSGAVLPGVTVTVRNQETGIARDLLTDDQGNYEGSSLIAGRYEVQAELKGFKKFVRRDVVVEVTGKYRVDATLEVGGAQEVVEVVAAAPIVKSEDGRIGSVFEKKVIINLPHLGRSGHFEYLAMTPGGSMTTQGRYSMNGSRGWSNGWVIDGVATERPTNGDNLSGVQTDRDAIQEVRYDSVNANAEFGHAATIATVTKSGTNTLHGSLELERQNGAWAAKNYFATAPPVIGSQNLSMTLGGPVVLPGLYDGRNRTFFFINKVLPKSPLETSARINVPTLLMRTGNFSEVTAAIRDPLTGQAFPGNIIPAGRLNASALKHQARFWDKLRPNFGPANSINGNFNYAWPRDAIGGPLTTRLDHKLSDRNTLYLSATATDIVLEQPARVLPLDVIGPLTRLRNSKTFSFSDAHIFSAAMVNELRVGVSRINWPLHGPLTGKQIVDEMGLTGFPGTVPEDVFGFPIVGITGFQEISQEDHSRDIATTVDIYDNFSWRRGRHMLKFGANLQYVQASGFLSTPSRVYGSFSFDGSFSGNPYADYLLGLPRTATRAGVVPPRYQRDKMVHFFAQDDWNVTPNLTLNLGLRYSLFLPYTEINDRVTNFDPVSGKLVVPNQKAQAQISPLFPTTIPVVTAAQAGFPERRILNTDTNDLAPRFGFAYRIGGSASTVVRGGYGIFYDNQANKAAGLLMSGGPFAGTETFDNTITAGVPLFAWPQAFPSATGSRPLGIQDLNAVAVDLRNSYSQQWNLSLEREVWGTGLRLSYIGVGSRQLPFRRNLNQPAASTTVFNQNRRPWPFVRNILFAQSGGSQSYNAMQFEATRRLRNGLAFDTHWTWASNLTDTPDDNPLGAQIEDAFNRIRDRGPEGYTPRHRFVTTANYDLPVGRGKRFLSGTNRLADLLVGGWSTSMIVQFQTGGFFTPTFSGSDPSNTNTTTGRPDRITDGNIDAGSRTISRWFDASAFSVPTGGRFGNAGRGILVGPGVSVAHLALFKSFAINERVSVRVYARSRNTFNHPNFTTPASNISIPGTVGRITATTIFSEVSTGGARSLVLGGRIEF